MHMLKVTVMMKRTHELGDGEDDHTVLYMSRCQYNITRTVSFAVDWKIPGVMPGVLC